MQIRPFQSTPVITDERIPLVESMGNWKGNRFNPRPSLLTSESIVVMRPGWIRSCFNPRPSLLTSESLHVQASDLPPQKARIARTCT